MYESATDLRYIQMVKVKGGVKSRLTGAAEFAGMSA
jgi:hypothetical protein